MKERNNNYLDRLRNKFPPIPPNHPSYFGALWIVQYTSVTNVIIDGHIYILIKASRVERTLSLV